MGRGHPQGAQVREVDLGLERRGGVVLDRGGAAQGRGPPGAEFGGGRGRHLAVGDQTHVQVVLEEATAQACVHFADFEGPDPSGMFRREKVSIYLRN